MTVSRAHDLLAGAALAVGVCVVAALLWSQPVRWMPDGYFYRALVLRVLGADEQDALQQVFDGPLTAADRAEEADLLPYERKLSNPDWVRESAQFYERRWVVPLLAAPLDDRLGARGLRAVSLAGYVLLAPLLYLLLRLWFPLRLALPAAALALLVEPLRTWSSSPLTDSWGLAFGTAALVFAVLALTRDARWLAAWAVAVLVLGFTRDLTLVLVGAALLTAILVRSGRALALAGTGFVAALPAPLLFGVPLKAAIAYPLNGYYPVDDPSWSYIADRYVGGAKALAKSDLSYIAHHPVSTAILIAGTLAVALLPPKGAARVFVWSAVPAALAYLFLTPNYTEFRLELAFLPLAALGLGALALRLEGIRRL